AMRARFARHAPAELVAGLGSLRPRPGSMVRYHTLLSLRELGRRAQYLDGQLQRLDEFIVPLVTARAPGLLALYGVGPDTAAMLLVGRPSRAAAFRGRLGAPVRDRPPLRILGKGHPLPAQP